MMKSILEQLVDEYARNPKLSATELAALVSRTNPADPSASAQETETANLGQLPLDHAAVMTDFDPDRLLDALPDQAQRASREVERSLLMRHSDLWPEEPTRRVLSATHRHDRLADLQESGRLSEVLAATEWIETDGQDTRSNDATNMLRKTLLHVAEGGLWAAINKISPDPESALDQLRSYAQILAWIAPNETGNRLLDSMLDRKRRDLQQLIVNAANRDRLRREALRFVGRETFLENLSRKVFHKAQGTSSPIIALHGMGGIGKSAVLGALVNKLSGENPDLLVARLDFDRPGFGTAETDFLTQQIVEQLAAQARLGANKVLSSSRKYLKGQGLEVTSANADSAVSQFVELRARIGFDRPVLLILDTLEERQRQGASPMSQLASWLSSLAMARGSETLGIIVAGRARPDANDFYFPPYIDEPIDDLIYKDRAELLVSLENSPQDSEKLAPLSGNPLLLHLISRLIQRENGPNADDLIGDGIDPAADAGYLQGMIYDRILGHVADESAKKLAYPGLVLREVTPEIISDVIAPVVLEEIVADRDRALELFEALRREVWLVEDAGEDTVRHRADVRRLMMTYLARDETVSQASRDIHVLAIAHFKQTNNQREADYHRAMIADPTDLAELGQRDAQQWLEHIGGDIDFVPKGIAATLRAHAGERLSDREISLLPDGLWSRYTDNIGPELVQNEDLRRARSFWSGDVTQYQPFWLLEARHGLGEVISSKEIEDRFDGYARIENRPLLTRIAMRTDDWELAQYVSRQGLAGFDDMSSSKTSLGRQSEESHVVVTANLELICYNILSTLMMESSLKETPSILRNLWISALDGTLRLMDFELLQAPDFKRLRSDDLIQLEELHRIRTLLRHYDSTALEDDFPGYSRFQFVPSIDWITAAHFAAREADEHLGVWGALHRKLLKGPENEGKYSARDITRDMANDAVSAITRMPKPFQNIAAFRGTGFREHRLPLRFALAEAIGSDPKKLRRVLEELGDLCRAHKCLVPRELVRLENLNVGSREALELQLVPIIHYADQCGLLPRYCERLVGIWPSADKLIDITNAVTLWAAVFPQADFSSSANQDFI